MDENKIEPKRRLFDFDFSQEGAEVSLVDKAANGTQFLILKAEKIEPEVTKQPDKIQKNLSALMNMLSKLQNPESAPQLEKPMSTMQDLEPLGSRLEDFIKFIDKFLFGNEEIQNDPIKERVSEVNPSSIPAPAFVIEKNEEVSMSIEDVIKSEDGQKLIAELINKAVEPIKVENETLRKSLEFFEKEQQKLREQQFVDIAKSLSSLGFTDEHGPLLKSVCDKAPEEFKVISELLEKAVSIKGKADMFKEVGETVQEVVISDNGLPSDIVFKSKDLMAQDPTLTQPVAVAMALKIKHKR